MALLKRGLAGEPVKKLQEKPPEDRGGARDLSAEPRAAVDGIAGPDTFTHMALYELVLLRTGTSGEAVKKLHRT